MSRASASMPSIDALPFRWDSFSIDTEEMELPLLEVGPGVGSCGGCEPVGITTFSVAMASDRKQTRDV